MKGSFSEDALEQFARLAAEKQGLDFAEGEVYDFARCVRSDGSFYGTGGKCRKGTEAGAKEKAEELASRVTATPGMAAKVKAAKEKLKAEKAANGGKRTDRVQEEKRLERNRQQREMDRKLKAQQERQREMLRQSGDSGKKV